MTATIRIASFDRRTTAGTVRAWLVHPAKTRSTTACDS